MAMALEFEDPTVSAERARRLATWHELQSSGSGLFEPARLNEARVFYGGRGIWVHQEITKGLGGYRSGVTVALLHTGSSYADDLSDEEVVYHYPQTKVSGRDLAEVEATKAAMWLKIPVFVVMYPSPNSAKRRVHLGWVQEYDDEQRWFLVRFGEEPVAPEPNLVEDRPFWGRAQRNTQSTCLKPALGSPNSSSTCSAATRAAVLHAT